jgi:hypothetical protein
MFITSLSSPPSGATLNANATPRPPPDSQDDDDEEEEDGGGGGGGGGGGKRKRGGNGKGGEKGASKRVRGGVPLLVLGAGGILGKGKEKEKELVKQDFLVGPTDPNTQLKVCMCVQGRPMPVSVSVSVCLCMHAGDGVPIALVLLVLHRITGLDASLTHAERPSFSPSPFFLSRHVHVHVRRPWRSTKWTSTPSTGSSTASRYIHTSVRAYVLANELHTHTHTHNTPPFPPPPFHSKPPHHHHHPPHHPTHARTRGHNRRTGGWSPRWST